MAKKTKAELLNEIDRLRDEMHASSDVLDEKVKAFVKKAKDSKKLSKDSTMTEVAEIVKERVADANPNLSKDSAKMEAMSDLVNDNADMANIVTQL